MKAQCRRRCGALLGNSCENRGREDQEGMGAGSAVRKAQPGSAEMGIEGFMTPGTCVAGC